MTNDPLKSTLEVQYEGDTYNFKIPSQLDSVRLGSYARMLRAELSPDNNPSAEGLDEYSQFICMALAAFKVLLVPPTSAEWVFSENSNGEPEIILENFPTDAPVMEVYGEFLKAVDRFHTGGDTDVQPKRGEVMGSGENPRRESV